MKLRFIKLANFFLLLSAVAIATLAIDQFRLREGLQNEINKEITKLQEDIAEYVRNGQENLVKEYPQIGEIKVVDYLNKRIEDLIEEKNRIDHLIKYGASAPFIDVISIKQSILHVAEDVHIFEIDTSFSDRTEFLYHKNNPLVQINNSLLIAIVIISASLVGVCIANIRSKSLLSIEDISLGLGTGFVIYIGVNGGYAAITTSGSTDIELSPYSMAFIATLSGIFSEKLYQALAKLFDSTIKANLTSQSTGTK